MISGFLPRRGVIYQPRVTPWVRENRNPNGALKGRDNRVVRRYESPVCFALSGLPCSFDTAPRAALRGSRRSALPWADLWLPLRGEGKLSC